MHRQLTDLKSYTCILIVGPKPDKINLVDEHGGDMLAWRRTEVGLWGIFKTTDQAWMTLMSIRQKLPLLRVVMAHGPVLREGVRWRSPILAWMTTQSLIVGASIVVMDEMIRGELMAHGRLDLHSIVKIELSGKSCWLGALDDEDGWLDMGRVRTNVTRQASLCFGRKDALGQMQVASQKSRILGVYGMAGVGKTLCVRHWVEQRLLSDHLMSAWWLSLMHAQSIMDVATALARFWKVSLPTEDPEHWIEILSAHFAAQNHNTWIILDDVDTLAQPALDWLHKLMSNDRVMRWIITSRQAHDWPKGKNIGLSPLDLTASVLLLDTRAGGAQMDARRLEHLVQCARACQGHALSLDMIARSLAPILTWPSLLTDISPDQASTLNPQLQVAWRRLSSEHHQLLFVLCCFERAFDEQTASAIVSGAQGLLATEVADMLKTLEQRAWLQASPDRQSLWMPHMVRRFVQAQMTPDMLKTFQSDTKTALNKLAWYWLCAMEGTKEQLMLDRLLRYEHDLIAIITQGIENNQRDVIPLLVALRRCYKRALASFSYLNLVELALTHAQAQSWVRESVQLKACAAIVHDMDYMEQDKAQALFEEVQSQKIHLDGQLYVEMDQLWARFLEETLELEPQRQSRFELLQHAYAQSVESGYVLHAAMIAALHAEHICPYDLDAAFEWSSLARQHAHACGAATAIANANYASHRVYMIMGRLGEARQYAERAYDAAQKTGIKPVQVMMLASVGYADAQLGDMVAARKYFHAALSMSQSCAFVFGEANTAFLLGTAYMPGGQFEAAYTYLNQALELYEAGHQLYNANLCKFWLGCALVCMGTYTRGQDYIEAARAFFDVSDSPENQHVINMLSLIPAIYKAGWIDRDREALAQLAVEKKQREDPSIAMEASIIDFFLTRADVAISREDGAILEVAHDSSGFCAPGEDWVDIRRRKTLRRILAALVRAKQETGHLEISAQDLLEAGWPDQQLEPRSGLMRLYVAINTLRKLGLDDVLETTSDGYRFHPTVQLKFGQPEKVS